MELTNDILQKIKTCGALGYPARRVAVLVNLASVDQDDFFRDFYDVNSMIYKVYHQGVAIGEYNQDAALMKQAENGDLYAIQELKIRQFNSDLDSDRIERFGI